MREELHKLIHGEGGVLDLVWMFYEGAIGIDPIISRIGKAYAEGMPLPGEVERYSNKGELTGPEWIMEMYLGFGAREFIALRKEENK